MAKIKGIENMTGHQLETELARGAKFVVYQYTISILVMTFMRPSAITFVKADQSAVGKGLGYTLVTLLLGWWGIPWGPIRVIQALNTNLKGGKDVTNEVVSALRTSAQTSSVQ